MSQTADERYFRLIIFKAAIKNVREKSLEENAAHLFL